ncbi:hemolysin family protein [Pannus brasiliensis CCIBt3594]|uniref:Hemolysin family protein n=1 Tax=Pannus brasiliensis CCIBt3594 TaxID=1427578 RepID=A0AAW9QUF1_9CHRO
MLSAITEILVILLLVLLNAVFALSEIAIVSARKIRLEQLARDDKRAEVALRLANDPNQMLSTVQIGITLVGIFAGAYGGANLSANVAEFLEGIPILAPYSKALGLGLVVLCITYLSLVIGELVPKRLGLSNPEKIAILVARPLDWLSKIVAPIVNLLGFSTNLILRSLGININTIEAPITEEELKIMLKQGTEAGTFEEAEQDMVERVLELGDRRVSQIMTTRPDIVWLDLEDSAEINRSKVIETHYTRFPVCQGSLDEVLGVIEVTDLLSDCLTGQGFDLTKALQQPLFVPESTRGLKVLELFQQTGRHNALVVDEYGVIQGVVTRKDILEAIVGDLPRLEDIDDAQIVRREDGTWLLDGTLAIEDFKDLFEIEELPGEKQGNYHTLGGFVITHLGRIPNAADHFEWERLRFEVVDMDGNRVDKILVAPVADS